MYDPPKIRSPNPPLNSKYCESYSNQISICKKSIKIYSINVGGLSTKYDMGILDEVICNYDIICLTETKTNHIENFAFDGFKVMTMPIKNKTHKFGGIHGICMLIRDELYDSIELICEQTTSESILWCKVNSKDFDLSFYIGNVYVPHESSIYHHKDLFDNAIRDISILQSRSNIPFILIGDFNARTGQLNDFEVIDTYMADVCGLTTDDSIIDSFHECNIPIQRTNQDLHINDNGKKLIDLCKITDLKIMNGRLDKDRGIGSFTCYTGMGQSTIDYLIVSEAILPAITSFQVHSFDRCLSDVHCGLSLSIESTYENNNPKHTDNGTFKNNTSLKYDLKWDQNVRADFMKNFDTSAIAIIDETLDRLDTNRVTFEVINDINKSIKDIFTKTAKDTNLYAECKEHKSIKKNRRINAPWFDHDCYEARKKYSKIKNRLQKRKNEYYISEIRKESNIYKKLIKLKKETYQAELHSKLRHDQKSNPKDFWRVINRKGNNISKIDIETFKTYFENLNSSSITHDNLVVDSIEANHSFNDPFTFEELKAHILLLKNNKASGYDRILNEHLKNCPDSLIRLLTKYFNVVLDSGLVPSDWCIGMIQPIFKNKGSEKDPDNYRGISLISCVGKLFTSCINSRLTAFLNENNTIQENQAGFRENYCTLDHIFVLNSVIELYLAKRKRVYSAFIDYRKAFDLVDRSSLWLKMLSYDIQGKLLRIIKNIYDNIKSCVKVGNHISDFFASKIGVRQGDNLSPLLFAIYLNDFEKFLSNHYNGLQNLADIFKVDSCDDELDIYLKLFILLYADDTVILAETEDDLQKALDALSEYCMLWHLEVNLDKSKIVIFSRGKITKFRKFTYREDVVEVVHDYIYLGTVFNFNNKFNKAINRQLILAKKALFSLKSKILSMKLPMDLQISLFNKLVAPVLTYGCEVWGFSNFNSHQIFQRKFIKDSLGVNKYTCNSIAFGETGILDIEVDIYTRMVTFWNKVRHGHETKISNKVYRILKFLYDKNIYKSHWCSQIHDILNNTGLSFLWNHDGIAGSRLKMIIKQRLSDAFRQNWSSSITENILCTNYRLFKQNFEFEHYLSLLDEDLRRPITKFRCGAHNLPISHERYLPPNETNLCPLCSTDIGDEYHYILVCPAFTNHRKQYLDSHQYQRPNVMKFHDVFTCRNKKSLENLSKFIKIILYVVRT